MGHYELSGRWVYLTAFIAVFSAQSSAIFAQQYFADDLVRSAWGFIGDMNVGRFVAQLLATILHGGSDAYPTTAFSRILAVGVFALVVLRLTQLISPNGSSALAAGLLAAGGTFILANIAHSLDAPFMALAILASVEGGKSHGSSLRSFLAVILAASAFAMYQPALGAFVAISGFIGIRTCFESGVVSAVRLATLKVVQLLLGFALYWVILNIVVPDFGESGTYASDHTTLDFSPANIVSSLGKGSSIFFESWSARPEGFIMAALVAVAAVAILVQSFRAGTPVKGVASFAFSTIALVVIVLAPMLVQLGVAFPVFRPRTFYSIGVSFTVMAGLGIIYLPPVAKPVINVLCVVLFLHGGIYTSVFQQALRSQYNLEVPILLEAMDKVYRYSGGRPKVLSVSGTTGLSNYASRIKAKYPALDGGTLYPVAGTSWLTLPLIQSLGFSGGFSRTRFKGGEIIDSGRGYSISRKGDAFQINLQKP